MDHDDTTATGERAARAAAYPPIGDYGAIGDGHSLALVSRDGSVDWLCWPDFDSPSLFAAILDRDRGGAFRVGPAGPARVRRRYRDGTAVLETTFACPDGRLRLTDAMAIDCEAAFAPVRQMVRTIEALEGEPKITVACAPRPNCGLRTPRPKRRGRLGWFLETGAGAVVLASDTPLSPSGDGATLVGRERLAAGERRRFSLAFAGSAPATLAPLETVEGVLEETTGFWRGWSGRIGYEGALRDAVVRLHRHAEAPHLRAIRGGGGRRDHAPSPAGAAGLRGRRRRLANAPRHHGGAGHLRHPPRPRLRPSRLIGNGVALTHRKATARAPWEEAGGGRRASGPPAVPGPLARCDPASARADPCRTGRSIGPMRATILAAALAAVFAATPAAAAPEPEDPARQTSWGLYLTAKEAFDMKTARGDEVLFVDVREPVEIMFTGFTDVVDVNVPFLMVNPSEWHPKKPVLKMEKNPAFANMIAAEMAARGMDETTPVILMCRSGGSRGAPSATALEGLGLEEVYVVVDGFEGSTVKGHVSGPWRLKNGWKNSGLPWSYALDPDKIHTRAKGF